MKRQLEGKLIECYNLLHECHSLKTMIKRSSQFKNFDSLDKDFIFAVERSIKELKEEIVPTPSNAEKFILGKRR